MFRVHSRFTKSATLAGLAAILALAAAPLAAHADDNGEALRQIAATPAARVAGVDYGLTVVPYLTSDGGEQLYVWSTYYQASFFLVELAHDDLYDLGATPLGTQIKFAVDGGLGTVTVTNQGGGNLSGTYNDLAFGFYSEAAQDSVYDGGWPTALAHARPAALNALGKAQEAAVAQAVLNALPR